MIIVICKDYVANISEGRQQRSFHLKHQIELIRLCCSSFTFAMSHQKSHDNQLTLFIGLLSGIKINRLPYFCQNYNERVIKSRDIENILFCYWWWVRIYIMSSKIEYHVDLPFLRVSWIYRCHRSHNCFILLTIDQKIWNTVVVVLSPLTTSFFLFNNKVLIIKWIYFSFLIKYYLTNN